MMRPEDDMNRVEYVKLNDVDPAKFLALLNKQKIRQHLVDHPLFDVGTVNAWLETKIEMDASPGCKVRAVVVDKQLAGWCGIQRENEKYELAVILDDGYWGLGRTLLRELMVWAKDLGHKTIFIHFLHTRPEYRHLRKIARNVYKSKLLGSEFTTYELAVE
ncbi:MAG: GNAT family N-acetyltransferase [Pseudomonadota bacterium]